MSKYMYGVLRKNSSCRKAEIHRYDLQVGWCILTLDYNPDDKWWCMRDDPRPYVYWTDEYRAEIHFTDSLRYKDIVVEVEGKDEANNLWKYLKSASVDDIINKYGNSI